MAEVLEQPSTDAVPKMPDVMGEAKAIGGELAGIQRERMAATDKASGEMTAALDRDRARAEDAYKTAGASAADLKPWNTEQEMAKRRVDPVESFGSFGSVFGILASAFTHAPMENALNASAAAMTAIKEAKADEYNTAYKAWQDNTKLALDRHKIQHEAYEDALSLLKTDAELGKVKLQVAAARFDDKKTLALLEAGMDKEVIDTLQARQRLATSLAEAQPKIWLENEKMRDLINDSRYKLPPDDPKRQQMISEWNQRWSSYGSRAAGNPLQTFTQRYFAEHPDATTDDYSRALADFTRGTGLGKGGGSSNTALTTERQIAADVDRIVQQYQKDHPDATPEDIAQYRAQQTRQLKSQSSAPSGNRVDDIKSRVDRIHYMRDTIHKVEDLLKKHKAITGLGGKITRPAEVVGNIFGNNETDRKQFERYIAELQEWAPRIMNDASGRPLASEAGSISKVIAGLQLGDTIQNTERAYRELLPLLDKMENNLNSRISGGARAKPADSSSVSKPAPSWKNAPLVQ